MRKFILKENDKGVAEQPFDKVTMTMNHDLITHLSRS